ncbi:peptidase dimerization domain-containing protein [Pseudorhodoferax sp.]|uniref:peptidase dimerization domain-containing protein n=1 Tax=Pseudorhodoferax sp. TaxID=1993553 RepID=UPI002DD65F26|nr:peptidase dimerization domain-containing protein [Pseudorhodoferax sp.]
MMKKAFASLASFAGLSLICLSAAAQQTGTVDINFQGPGGHSSGNYGRTSAVHAAGRTVILIQKAGLPAGSYVITNLTGGNSVNSIASDGLITLRLRAADTGAYDQLVSKLTELATAGADAENAFRNVKAGDLTAGAPATIRVSLTRK